MKKTNRKSVVESKCHMRNSGEVLYVSTKFSLSMEMSMLTRDKTAEPVSRDQILRRERGQSFFFFPVQLTTCRIGNLTRLIHTLAIYVTIHTYIHTYIHKVREEGVEPVLITSYPWYLFLFVSVGFGR